MEKRLSLYKKIVDDKKMALQVGALILVKKTTEPIYYMDYL